MTPPIAPFSGSLIEIPNRADRVAFCRTVCELTRSGALPSDTRIIPAGGDLLLTTLSLRQIMDVRSALHIQRVA